MSNPLKTFATKIRNECIDGSAIAPDLYTAAISIVRDTVYDSITKEAIAFPIDEALGRNPTRFGRQARENVFAALFTNEDGSTWQAKLSSPKPDAKKTKAAFKRELKLQSWDIEPRYFELMREYPKLVVYRKYESVTGGGSTPFLPAVPASIRQKIGDRYGVEVPADGSFWEWLEAQPMLPLTYTEGGKKALSLLSQGYIAIGLYGVNGGYVAAKDGTPRGLLPALDRFTGTDKKKRPVFLAFDEDTNPATRRRVRLAKLVFGNVLKFSRCDVRVMSWEPSQGKGADDVIVQSGAGVVEASYQSAQSFAVWSTSELRGLGKYAPSLEIETRYFGEIDLPMSAKMICLLGGKGTGKTSLIARYVAQIKKAMDEGKRVLLIAHRIQLVQAICDALGIRSIYEVKGGVGFGDRQSLRLEVQLDGLGLCVASLHPNGQGKFDPTGWEDSLIIIDEAEQVIWEMLSSRTCEDHRVSILQNFSELMKLVLSPESEGQVILSDADLSHVVIDAVLRAGNQAGTEPYIVRNQWKQSGYQATMFEDMAVWQKTVFARLSDKQKVLMFSDTQKRKSVTGTIQLEKRVLKQFPGLRVLRVDSKTLNQRNHPAYGCMKQIALSCNIETRKEENKVMKLDWMAVDYDLVICSPSVETGISLDTKGHFDFVAGCFTGVMTTDSVRQALMRLREPVERLIYCASFSASGLVAGGDTYWRSVRSTTDKVTAATLDTLDRAGRGSHADDDDFGAAMKDTYSKMAARQNAGKLEYFEAVRAGLVAEGCTVGICDRIKENPISKEIRGEWVVEKHDALLSHGETLTHGTDDIDDKQAAKYMGAKGVPNEQAQNELDRYLIKKRYGIEMTPDLYILDSHGWDKGLELDYYFGEGREHLNERDKAQLASLTHDGAVWGIDVARTTLALKIHAFDVLGIQAIIDAANEPHPDRPGDLAGISDDHPLIVELAARCLEPANARQLKQVLDISPPKARVDGSIGGVALLSRFLKKLGKKTECIRKAITLEGDRKRIYSVIDYDYRELASLDESGEVDRKAACYSCDRADVFEHWLARDLAQNGENPNSSKTVKNGLKAITTRLAKTAEPVDATTIEPATTVEESTAILRIRSSTPINKCGRNSAEQTQNTPSTKGAAGELPMSVDEAEFAALVEALDREDLAMAA